jgi:hypothetical protein
MELNSLRFEMACCDLRADAAAGTQRLIAMHWLLRLCSLPLMTVLACGIAFAQSDAQPKSGTRALTPSTATTLPSGQQTPEQLQARAKAWFTTCMQDWDASTHMTRKEWERACQRVSGERTKFLKDWPK